MLRSSELKKIINEVAENNNSKKSGIKLKKDEIKRLTNAINSLIKDDQKASLAMELLEDIEGSKSNKKRKNSKKGSKKKSYNKPQNISITQFSLDKARDAVFWVGSKGELVYVNESACNSLEYTRDELLSKSIFDIDTSFSKTKWKKHWDKTRELNSFTTESCQKTKSGKVFPVEITIKFLTFEGKEYHSAFVRDISERKTAEEQLRITQFGIENSQIGIYQVDDDGNIIYANDYGCKILGYTKEEILKQKIWNIDLSLKSVVWKEHRASARSKEVISIETTHRRKDGSIFPVEVHVDFFEFGNKSISFSFTKDITERRIAEEKLKEETKRTSTLLKISSQLNSVLNIDKVLNMVCTETSIALNVPAVSILLVNKETERLEYIKSIGVSDENDSNMQFATDSIIKSLANKNEVIKFPLTIEPGSTSDMTPCNSNIRSLTFAGMLYNENLIGVLNIINSERKFGEDELNLLQGIANQAALAIHNARLLSEYKKTEKALRSNEYLLKESQKIAMFGYYTYDVASGNWEASETLSNIFDIDISYKKDVKGWLEIIHHEDREMMMKYLSTNILKEHQPFDKEYKIVRHNDGQERWVLGKGQLQMDNDGNVMQMIGTIQDITEQKKIQNELIAAKEKAEDMSRLKSNFLANMSHELRTPLFGIIGLTELLTHEITIPDHKEMIDAVYESSKRLSETLNLILDLSKIENNKFEMNAVPFDISAASLNVVNTFKEVAKKKGIYLKIESNNSKNKIKLDKRAFESILNNLVNNAVKFTRTGGVTVITSEENSEGEDFLILKVIDTGIGIDKKDFDIIFEEFRQASEGLNRNFEGSGLGLNITKRFIERLNGLILVESELNKGTTFTVKLPIIKAIVSEKKSSEKKEIIQLDYVPVLLLVDDDFNVKSILNNYLSPQFKLIHVANAEDAINLVQKEKFDGILMDINLKGLIDGVKATKEIRKIPNYEDIPIIACTAYAMAGDKEEFIEAGCSHYIAKPFNKNEIIALLKGIFR